MGFVKIGGGTGWNIEEMSRYLDVQTYFDRVYLVDFSPSLCEVARKRFARLRWDNVEVVCQDAREFRLEDANLSSDEAQSQHAGADLITMSYSLSMIVRRS